MVSLFILVSERTVDGEYSVPLGSPHTVQNAFCGTIHVRMLFSLVPRPLSSPPFYYSALRNGVKWPADGWGLVYETTCCCDAEG